MKYPSKPTESWVSVDEVAVHLGVAKDSIYRWIESKELPAHKIGKLWKFKLSEVDGWVRTSSAAERSDGQARSTPNAKRGNKR